MILAVDPGGNTGWVILDGEVLHSWGEERNHLEFLSWTWLMLSGVLAGTGQSLVDTVVCERWINVQGRPMSFQPTALEIIGTLRWQCHYTEVPFILQGAADAKAWGTSQRLEPYRQDGCGHGGAGHALMALSHALLYLGTRKAVRR